MRQEQNQTYDIPVDETIKQLGLNINEMRVEGDKFYICNQRENPFQTPYFDNDLRTTVNEAIKALIDSHEFDDKLDVVMDKFAPLLINALYDLKKGFYILPSHDNLLTSF